jgi:hypothetical protein
MLHDYGDGNEMGEKFVQDKIRLKVVGKIENLTIL